MVDATAFWNQPADSTDVDEIFLIDPAETGPRSFRGQKWVLFSPPAYEVTKQSDGATDKIIQHFSLVTSSITPSQFFSATLGTESEPRITLLGLLVHVAHSQLSPNTDAATHQHSLRLYVRRGAAPVETTNLPSMKPIVWNSIDVTGKITGSQISAGPYPVRFSEPLAFDRADAQANSIPFHIYAQLAHYRSGYQAHTVQSTYKVAIRLSFILVSEGLKALFPDMLALWNGLFKDQ